MIFVLVLSIDQASGVGEEVRLVTRQQRFTCDATLSENNKSSYF